MAEKTEPKKVVPHVELDPISGKGWEDEVDIDDEEDEQREEATREASELRRDNGTKEE